MSKEDKSFSQNLSHTYTHTYIPCCRSHCCPEMSEWQRAAHPLGRHTLSSYVSLPRLQSLRSWNAHTHTQRRLVCKYACQTVNKLKKISGWWGGKIRAARRQRRRKRRARYRGTWQLFRKRNNWKQNRSNSGCISRSAPKGRFSRKHLTWVQTVVAVVGAGQLYPGCWSLILTANNHSNAALIISQHSRI